MKRLGYELEPNENVAKRAALLAIKLRRFAEFMPKKETAVLKRKFAKIMLEVLFETSPGEEFFQHFGKAFEAGLNENSQKVLTYLFLLSNWRIADTKESAKKLYDWVQEQPRMQETVPETEENFFKVLRQIGWRPKKLRRGRAGK